MTKQNLLSFNSFLHDSLCSHTCVAAAFLMVIERQKLSGKIELGLVDFSGKGKTLSIRSFKVLIFLVSEIF